MAFSWSRKRQLAIALALGALVLGIASVVLIPVLRVPASCSDGKHNGSEAGIDCGGSCRYLCAADVRAPIALWSRTVEVIPAVYTAVAMIENQNADGAIRAVEYEFSLYDAENTFIGRKTGRTFIGPNGVFPIIETGIRTGSRIPRRTAFRFVALPAWERSPVPAAELLGVSVRDYQYSLGSQGPRISAVLENASLESIRDIEVSALVYDADGNMIGASKTYLDEVPASGSREVFFSWPYAFAGAVDAVEIVPRANPFALPVR